MITRDKQAHHALHKPSRSVRRYLTEGYRTKIGAACGSERTFPWPSVRCLLTLPDGLRNAWRACLPLVLIMFYVSKVIGKQS